MIERDVTITVDGEPEGGRFGMDGSGSPGVARPIPTSAGRIYVQQDANWNTTALVDTSGTVQQRIVYDPYGAATFLSASWASSTDVYMFLELSQGSRSDSVTGLVGSRERDRNVNTARWQQADPAGYIDGANRYQAMGSAPTEYADPSGFSWVSTSSVQLLCIIPLVGRASACLPQHAAAPASSLPPLGPDGIGDDGEYYQFLRKLIKKLWENVKKSDDPNEQERILDEIDKLIDKVSHAPKGPPSMNRRHYDPRMSPVDPWQPGWKFRDTPLGKLWHHVWINIPQARPQQPMWVNWNVEPIVEP
jgi:RHS repeat-associated protein